jgi:hypothetical protein
MITRRNLLLAGAAAVAGLSPAMKAIGGQAAGGTPKERIPLVHMTDLYHPPQDPDDHVDLATVASLDEYDLKGVVLDVTRKFLFASPEGFDIRRDPGFVPVVQLGWLLGRAIPVAAGPTLPLSRPDDDAADRPPGEQAGVKLFLDILEECRDDVVVSVVGSARALTAAYNRYPALVRSKVRAVLLNAGSMAGPKREWNVGLDPDAYIGLWRSGLPIHWYPCATETGAFNPDHERGTFWKTTHERLFRDLAPSLRAWFTYAFSPGGGNNIIGALADAGPPAAWQRILADKRNMWATASLVMGAGRVLARTAGGWRFVPDSAMDRNSAWSWRLDRIEARVNERAEIDWHTVKEGGNALLFGRGRGPEFADAMAEALCALLGSLRF